jgi:hypothetical protein
MPSTLSPTAIQDLLSGVSSNALWSLVAHIGSKAISAVQAKLKGDPMVGMYTSSASEVCAGLVESAAEQLRLKQFLTSPEVEGIVRQVYAADLIEDGKRHLAFIREEFTLSLARYLDVSLERAKSASDLLFDALLQECDRHMKAAIQGNVLAAHEGKSVARHRQLLGEILGIKRNLDLLATTQDLDVHEILRFEESFRAQMATRHGSIQPPHLEAARRYPIDDLYVTPTLVSGPLRKERELRNVSISHFLDGTHRAVVLGNPGGGKSTLASKLCHDLAAKYDDRLLNHRRVTPILVVLREYGGQKKSDHCSILQFVETQARSRYQIAPPKGAFEYLLLNGRVVVIFDGLDELLDTSYRREISEDVECFCNLYPAVPVLVTSREVGYDQAPLDKKQFRLVKIAPFSVEQVREYATKWFALDAELTTDACKQKAESFMKESALANDLRSNPLMLGLMCNLYRVEGYIPRNRPDIYEKCSLMLFERWDKGRGIVVALPFEERIRPAMRHLAYWIYSKEALQGGVTHSKLIAETSSYLETRVFEDPDVARQAAVAFIDFCTGRAWVFTDTGTTPEGEKLFQFTHRTFLEYFAASYLFSIHPTPNQLLPTLTPHIAEQEWDMVAQLAFQIQSRNVEGAEDNLLSGLLEEGIQASRERRWNILLFAVRMLESIVPSPAVRRSVTTAGLRELVAFSHLIPRKNRYLDEHAMLSALTNSSEENRKTVGETAEHVLTDIIFSSESTEQDRSAAFQIAYQIQNPIYRDARRSQASEPYWINVARQIVTRSKEQLRALAQKDGYLATTAYEEGDLSVDELLEWHGTDAIFEDYHSRPFGIRWPSLAIRLLLDFCHQHGQAGSNPRDMSAVGRFLIGITPPWARKTRDSRSRSETIFFREIMDSGSKEHGQSSGTDLNVDARFAVFALFACVLESLNGDSQAEISAKMPGTLVSYLSPVSSWALTERCAGANPDKPQDRPVSHDRYDELAIRWARRKISFVAHSDPERADLVEENS